MSKKSSCALCGGGVDFQILYGDPETNHGWAALQCCYYCKAIFEGFTMGNMMSTRLNPGVLKDQKRAVKHAKRIMKLGRKGFKKSA